jgi:AcrR family transcriptional regulator
VISAIIRLIFSPSQTQLFLGLKMGRKNKSEEKRLIILNAFESVILKEGFANASQRKIAEAAGVNQPMIHHYFSGGDELLGALLERITQRYREALSSFTEAESSPSLESILGFLCSEEFHQVSKQNEVMFCLIGQSKHHETALKLLSNVYQTLIEELRKYLEAAGVTNLEQVSYTLMCLIIGHDWAKALGFGEHKNEMMTDTLSTLAKVN